LRQGAVSKTTALAIAASKALAHPHLALLALRERGLAYVVSVLAQSSGEELAGIVRRLELRGLVDSRDDLQRFLGDALSDISDEGDRHYRVQLTTGEKFLIRKAMCMADMYTIYETFVHGMYAEHPPLQGRNVLDIGANLGDTAVYFARLGARVFACEPSREMYDLAVRNAALNSVAIEFFNVGVGCADEVLELAVGPRGASPLSTTLFPGGVEPRDTKLTERVRIRIVPLASLLAWAGPVFLLKMDCQGCEYPALLGLNGEQLRTIDHVFMEYHGAPELLREKFEANGFTVRMRDGRFMLADQRAH
jgi:FkbM family methyltransferase